MRKVKLHLSYDQACALKAMIMVCAQKCSEQIKDDADRMWIAMLQIIYADLIKKTIFTFDGSSYFKFNVAEGYAIKDALRVMEGEISHELGEALRVQSLQELEKQLPNIG